MRNPFNKREVLKALPVTAEGLDAFVVEICNEYGFENNADTYDVIATMIMHSNQGVTHAPLSYFGNAILNSMSKKAAYDKLKQLSRDRAALEETKAMEAKQNQVVTHQDATTSEQA